jgi:hypothetical protein
MRARGSDLDDLSVSAVAWEVRNQQTKQLEQAIASSEHPAVKEIRYHSALGEGDSHFADVYMETGAVQRIFNITQVVFNHEASSDDTERADRCEDQTEDEQGAALDGNSETD